MTPIALHAFNRGGGPEPTTSGGNWTWLIPGRVPTLIDAGVGDPRHLEALHHALNGTALAYVLVTHGHSDHVSGVDAIADRMPGTRFLKMPWPERDGRWRVSWVAVADGDTIQAGDTVLTTVHTPGHAPDHLCFWHAETRTVFGGDLVIHGSTVYIPATLQGDVAAYVMSLERILALNPERLLPAHGPVIEKPESLLRMSIAHRREREEQIVDALRGGETRVDAIVARIYHELHDHLVPRARETVVAHLQKLEREGRAARRDDGWHIV